MATIEPEARCDAVPEREGEYGARVVAVEPGGIEHIPERERHGSPLEPFWTWTSANMEIFTPARRLPQETWGLATESLAANSESTI